MCIRDRPWGDPEKNPEIMNPTLVSGAWQLGEWNRDEYAIFVPNEKYFDQTPAVDSWTVRIIPDPTIQFQLLQMGEVNFAAPYTIFQTNANELAIVSRLLFEPSSHRQFAPPLRFWLFGSCINLKVQDLDDLKGFW